MARRKDPLIWGIILILVGFVFILENFDIDAWNFAWKLWPVILIVWGANKLLAGLAAKKNGKIDLPPPGPPAPPQA
ncbi:MAG: hypothetical protein FJY82_13045 [Candidatus Aminicenantes bacterium]|nr:hypothetical protein [Candidatus Aminicenantes bacterium]